MTHIDSTKLNRVNTSNGQKQDSTDIVVSKSPHYLALLLLLNLKPPELDVEGLTKLLHAKDCVLLVLIIRVWLLKEGHLGAEEGVVGARPLEHHKSMVGLAHLVGSLEASSANIEIILSPLSTPCRRPHLGRSSR